MLPKPREETMNRGSSDSVTARQVEPPGKVVIVTDSIAQIPADLVRQYNIRIVPFHVTVKQTTYTDGVDLSVGELYKRMRQEKDLRLMTTAPSVGLFCRTFENCREEGVRRMLYIGVSGQLSGAVNSATAASRMMYTDFGAVQIEIFDSRMATIAQGFLALEAARMADAGAGLEEIVAYIEGERKHVGFIAGFETLEYLARGGRIGKAAYLLSDAIKVVPLVTLNDEGEVIPVSKVLG
ncbi:DegV family protein, partial [bacterium]|nr:DegV family protein [bacterium]